MWVTFAVAARFLSNVFVIVMQDEIFGLMVLRMQKQAQKVKLSLHYRDSYEHSR